MGAVDANGLTSHLSSADICDLCYAGQYDRADSVVKQLHGMDPKTFTHRVYVAPARDEAGGEDFCGCGWGGLARMSCAPTYDGAFLGQRSSRPPPA